MSHSAIRVEGLGKRYKLGLTHAGSIRELVNGAARRLTSRGPHRNGGDSALDPSRVDDAGYFWALRDVSFEVQPGEVVGIIGKNGAGKSTLLKILSRITTPTTGEVQLRGRVASLLEVGTGFHPELTGRENVYLNGTILGMTKREVDHQFDAIVAFAGVEKFIDTPVKRYSSGMTVRLGFAVAAHLNPEILIVDEVLAVGDGEFQRRCLGKLRSVAQDGRTVLFVSHNMAAVCTLTSHAVWLVDGRVHLASSTAAAVRAYIASQESRSQPTRLQSEGQHASIRSVKLLQNGEVTSVIASDAPLMIQIVFDTDGSPGLSLELFLVEHDGPRLGLFSLYNFNHYTLPPTPGSYRCTLSLPPLWIAAGDYSFDAATSIANTAWDHTVDGAARFTIPYCRPCEATWDFRSSSGFGFVALRPLGLPKIEPESRMTNDHTSHH